MLSDDYNMKNLLLFVGVFSYFFAHSQFYLRDKHFSKADTLRGALSSFRTCYDVFYYDLNLDVDHKKKYISGYNDIYFKAIENFSVLQIDLFQNMAIKSIEYKDQSLFFEREYNAVFVHFNKEIKENQLEKIRVYYDGHPLEAKNPPWDGGFIWSKDENSAPWVGVSCEGIGASLWWPNKDHLSDEPDSVRVTCTYPKGLMFVGNGVLEQNEVVGYKRKTTWFVSYPINNYNVSINIAKYVNFVDYYVSKFTGDKLKLDYWVLPFNLEKAKTHFEQAKPMLEAYEYYFGPYPFWKDNFKLVETSYLGMEHQSAISYGNRYQKGYNGGDYSRIGLDFDYIIIHESGHEYWGNLISCSDLADLWIHEGFCTYSEALYVEYLKGYDVALDYTLAKRRNVKNNLPMAGVYGVNDEGSSDIYDKGMLMIYTLRNVINNDKLWFNMLKEMTTSVFAYKCIETKDVIDFFNKKTKMNLRPIFNQYLYHAKIPRLYYSLEQEKGNRFIFKYKWEVDVEDFEMPISYSIGNKEYIINGTTSLQELSIKVKANNQFKINKDKYYIEVLDYGTL